MLKFTLLSLLVTTSVFADDILVVNSGKINIAYVSNGKVWTRACEDLAVVTKLNDCKATVERSIGTTTEVKDRIVGTLMGSNVSMTEVDKNIAYGKDGVKKLEDYKKAYGTPALSLEKDPIMKELLPKYLEFKKTITDNETIKSSMSSSIKLADDYLKKLNLSTIAILNPSATSFSKADAVVAEMMEFKFDVKGDYSTDIRLGQCVFMAEKRIWYHLKKNNAVILEYIFSGDQQTCGAKSLSDCIVDLSKKHKCHEERLVNAASGGTPSSGSPGVSQQ